jgi:hypothetical protein
MIFLFQKPGDFRPKIEKISPDMIFPSYIQALVPGLNRFIDVDASAR